VVLIGRALINAGEPVEFFSLRTPLVIFVSILVFAVLLERAGLILAGGALVGIGSFATEGFTPLRLLIYATALVLGVAGLFVALLGVQVPLLPTFWTF
jgi:putative tricarboxylic transport membrane protein